MNEYKRLFERQQKIWAKNLICHNVFLKPQNISYVLRLLENRFAFFTIYLAQSWTATEYYHDVYRSNTNHRCVKCSDKKQTLNSITVSFNYYLNSSFREYIHTRSCWRWKFRFVSWVGTLSKTRNHNQELYGRLRSASMISRFSRSSKHLGCWFYHQKNLYH